jgi:S1-C subfamily serine protease
MSAFATDLSAAAAAAVEAAGKSVLRVEGRRRGPSSGIAWSADGVIVAAHHNVEWDEDIAVGLADGSTARAERRRARRQHGRGRPARAVTGLAVPDWAAETPKVGHLSLALTRPGRTVRASLGVVHALGDEWRTPAGGRVDRYLQTDIGLQPGFSGSLLVDLAAGASA